MSESTKTATYYGAWHFGGVTPRDDGGMPLRRADSVHRSIDAAYHAASRLGAGAEVWVCTRRGDAVAPLRSAWEGRG